MEHSEEQGEDPGWMEIIHSIIYGAQFSSYLSLSHNDATFKLMAGVYFPGLAHTHGHAVKTRVDGKTFFY
jgi:hypothetical protein